MKLNDFFINAIRANAHFERAWVLRAFSVTQENPTAWESDKRAWRIVTTATGYFFVNEKLELEPIEGAVANQPMFTADTDIQAPAGFFQHWPEGGLTKAGNLLFNATAFWPSVGSKLGYINSEESPSTIEAMFVKMVDDPEPGEERDPGAVYVSDFIKFADGIRYLEGFTQVFCWSLTTKAITEPDNIEEVKKAIFAKYAGHMDDPVTQAKINAELVAYDKKEWLKGDPSERFLISGKSHNVRRKLWLAQGSEPGLDRTTNKLPYVEKSLTQGWDLDKLGDMINTQRAGSIDRGSETELGGVVAKWLARTTSNVRVVQEFCGTKVGDLLTITDKNKHELVGRYLVGKEPILVNTEEEAGKYLGKTLQVHAPHFCKSPKTDYCKICLGVNLSANENALSLAATTYGGGFLSMFLSSMHGKELKTATLVLDEVMS